MTDAPGVRAVVDASAKELGIPGVLATDGAYGHVKAGNTGVCAEARETKKNKPTRATRRTRAARGCGPWRTWR